MVSFTVSDLVRIFPNFMTFICMVHIACPQLLFCDGASLLECYTVLTQCNIPEKLNVESESSQVKCCCCWRVCWSCVGVLLVLHIRISMIWSFSGICMQVSFYIRQPAMRKWSWYLVFQNSTRQHLGLQNKCTMEPMHNLAGGGGYRINHGC